MTPEQTEYNRLLSQANRFVVGNQHALALDIYDKAIQMNPKRTDAWYHKGVVLVFLRRPNEALTCFETALKPEMEWGNVPADEVWAWKARALAFMGRFNEAIAAYDRALSINPNSSEVLKERQVFEGLLRQKGSPRQ